MRLSPNHEHEKSEMASEPGLGSLSAQAIASQAFAWASTIMQRASLPRTLTSRPWSGGQLISRNHNCHESDMASEPGLGSLPAQATASKAFVWASTIMKRASLPRPLASRPWSGGQLISRNYEYHQSQMASKQGHGSSSAQTTASPPSSKICRGRQERGSPS